MSAEQTPDIADVLDEAWIEQAIADEMPLDTHDAEWRATNAAAVIRAALAPVLAAAVREAEQRAWNEGALTSALMDAVFVPGPIRINKDGALVLTHDEARSAARRLLRDRADRITEPVSHEAATSGEEASKA